MKNTNQSNVEWGGFIPQNGQNRCVAYTLTHVKSGKVYSGSTTNIYNRRRAHLFALRRNEHHATLFQEAFNDDPNFNLKIYVAEDKESALDVEQDLIHVNMKLGISLNTASDARKSALGLKRSDKHRASISQAMSGRIISKETLLKMSLANLGKTQSPEQVAKRVASRKGYKHSQETITKIKLSNKGKGAGRTLEPKHTAKIREAALAKVKKVSVDGVVYGGIREASRALKHNPQTIRKYIDDPNKPTWRYIETG